MLAIAGGKGGCGKTTTTLGLAAALPDRTVVVDLDRGMPDLHSLAGVDRDPTVIAIDSANPEDTASRQESAEPPGSPGPRESPGFHSIAQSPSAYHAVSVFPAPRPDVERSHIETALRHLQGTDRTVLLDSPAGATESAALPLRVADRTLLVSTLCGPALRDTAKTAAMARTFDAPPIGVVLTRTRLRPDAVEALLDCPVVTSIPTVEPPVLETNVVQTAYERLADGIQLGT